MYEYDLRTLRFLRSLNCACCFFLNGQLTEADGSCAIPSSSVNISDEMNLLTSSYSEEHKMPCTSVTGFLLVDFI